MFRKVFLILIALFGLFGCADVYQSLNTDHPGMVPWQGGEVQFMFSNPEYTGTNTETDPLFRQDLAERQAFGKTVGSPAVTGGIGIMGTWRF